MYYHNAPQLSLPLVLNIGVTVIRTKLEQLVGRYFCLLLFCITICYGAQPSLYVVLNISSEENWATFVYLASDKLWRDPSELGGGEGGKYQYIFGPA